MTVKHLARLKRYLLVLTIAIAVLAPPISITETFSLRPEIIMAGLLFLSLLPTEGLAVLKHPVFKWMGLLAGLIAISLAYSAVFLGRPFSLQDTFEVFKVVVYAVVFYAALASRFDASEFAKAYPWIVGAFLTSATIGIMQYFNLLGINEYLTPLYTSPLLASAVTGRRIIGTVGNPNYYGMVMLFGVCLALGRLLWASSPRRRWLSALTLIMCTISMFLAASRTVMAIAALPILFVAIQFVLQSRSDKVKLRRVGIIALGLLATTVLLLLLMPSAWFSRMGELFSVFESESMVGKIANWRIHWDLYLQSPLMGLGPAKGLINLNVDNEWLLFLVRYGIGGVVLAAMLGISMFVASNALVREVPSTDLAGFGIALQAFLLAAPVFMLTAAIYHHQQLMAILLLMVGLGQGVRRSLEVMRQLGTEETAQVRA